MAEDGFVIHHIASASAVDAFFHLVSNVELGIGLRLVVSCYD